MKKSLFLILMVSLLVISACTDAQTQSLEAFYKDAKIEDVSEIIIQDGSTGASKKITEQNQIDDFLSLIKDIEFTTRNHQEKSVGWRYAITLVDGEKEFKFTLNDYDSKPDIHPIVDDYYKRLEIEER